MEGDQDVKDMYFQQDEDLIGKAAKANGITPENFKQLMKYLVP